MIGYHYTTQENADKILDTGLKLAPLGPEHRNRFTTVESFIKNGVIWLFRVPHEGESLLGMLIYVAINHYHHRICCFRVEYLQSESATMLAQQQSNAVVQLRHSLGAYFGHREQIIDLAIAPMPPNRISLIDQWDLCDAIKKEG